jgi:bifunctional oligoribonuclease and PAP phosphatase NrnA
VDVPGDLIDTLSSARLPVIVGHVTPDIDALGAMLALARALPSSDAVIAVPVPLKSQKLQFVMDLGGNIPLADPVSMAQADVFVVVDTASTKRVNVAGHWEAIADRFVVNIDHHITNPDYGRINWVVDNASSTCELIWRLIRAAGWVLDAPTAGLLYAGISSDTAGFSLPSTTADCLTAAADLVRSGADVDRIGCRISRSQERHEFDLIRKVYHNTRVVADGHIAYSTLTHEEIVSSGCSPQDIDDQVSIPRSLSGVRVALLFSEGEQGVIRINLRGEGPTPVLPLAEKLGGGGHTHSAGARIRGTMDEVVRRVLANAQQMVASLPATESSDTCTGE